jgi:hypothetical protein
VIFVYIDYIISTKEQRASEHNCMYEETGLDERMADRLKQHIQDCNPCKKEYINCLDFYKKMRDMSPWNSEKKHNLEKLLEELEEE